MAASDTRHFRSINNLPAAKCESDVNARKVTRELKGTTNSYGTTEDARDAFQSENENDSKLKPEPEPTKLICTSRATCLQRNLTMRNRSPTPDRKDEQIYFGTRCRNVSRPSNCAKLGLPLHFRFPRPICMVDFARRQPTCVTNFFDRSRDVVSVKIYFSLSSALSPSFPRASL